MSHVAFIVASYAITGAVVCALVGWILLDRARLERALKRFPPRDDADA